MRIARSIACLVLLGGFLVSGGALWADQMVPLSIEQLTAKAKLVLRGQVLDKTVQRDAEGRIYTTLRLQVAEIWRGSLATNLFTVVYGGGTLGDEVATVSGQADYEVGEEVAVFLILNPQGAGVSVGLSQGKFHVWRDSDSGVQLAHNRFHGLRPAASGLSPARSGRTNVLDRLTVAELKRRVQEQPQ